MNDLLDIVNKIKEKSSDEVKVVSSDESEEKLEVISIADYEIEEGKQILTKGNKYIVEKTFGGGQCYQVQGDNGFGTIILNKERFREAVICDNCRRKETKICDACC